MEAGYQIGGENEDKDYDSDDKSSLYHGIALQEPRETVSMEDDADDIVEDGQAL